MPLILPTFVPAIAAEKIQIKPIVEIREGFERRIDRDFNDTIPDGRGELASRYRLGADLKFNKDVSGKFIYQYSHSLFWTDARNFSDENSDLYVGQVDLKLNKGTLTAGRQIIRKGDNRLFEESNYSQRSKSYDGFRVRTDDWDLFAVKVGYSGNRSDQARLFGVAHKWDLGETMAVYKQDHWISQQSFWTLDHRYEANWRGINIALEGALQLGRTGTQDLEAFWLHARATKPLNPKWAVYAEGNIASGGSSGNTSHRFDPLYGTTHAPYGLSDLQGLRNMNHLELGVIHTPNKKATYTLSGHWFSLRDAQDGWYGTNARVNTFSGGQFLDPTGARGRDTGFELDFFGRWNLSSRDYIQLELAAFFPGKFVRSFTSPNDTNHYWGLLTYQLKL